MMKIDSININDIGGIDNLDIIFKNGLNILCGPNGVGKTTILECIAQPFTRFDSDIIRKNVNCHDGNWTLRIINEGIRKEKTFIAKQYHPEDKWYINDGFSDLSKFILVFKTDRGFQENKSVKLSNIVGLDEKKNVSYYTHTGVSSRNIKKWFVRRYFDITNNIYNDMNKYNLEIAIESFGILDENIRFSNVVCQYSAQELQKYDILVTTPQGDIYFEYLSSGFKSCLFILLGLIKELDCRFEKENLRIDEFSGVILIDEVDLHLHPQWQTKLIKSIQQIIPKAQIIITTHSPSIIQVAESKELIPLTFDTNGKVCIKNIPESEYGFQGWTIEEILEDVMGLEKIRSKLYLDTIKEFDIALDEKDNEKALKAYRILDEMLHPNNYLKKLLSLQLASIGGIEND